MPCLSKMTLKCHWWSNDTQMSLMEGSVILTHFTPLCHFYTRWNIRKPRFQEIWKCNIGLIIHPVNLNFSQLTLRRSLPGGYWLTLWKRKICFYWKKKKKNGKHFVFKTISPTAMKTLALWLVSQTRAWFPCMNIPVVSVKGQ